MHSETAANRMGYANPAMDEAVAALVAAATPEEQQARAAAINALVVDAAVYVPIGAFDEGAVWKDSVHGVENTVSTIFLFHRATVDE